MKSFVKHHKMNTLISESAIAPRSQNIIYGPSPSSFSLHKNSEIGSEPNEINRTPSTKSEALQQLCQDPEKSTL